MNGNKLLTGFLVLGMGLSLVACSSDKPEPKKEEAKVAEKKKEELEKQGIRADVLREEPFTTAQDNLEVHVYLMIWETRGRDRQVRIETIEQGKEGSTW